MAERSDTATESRITGNRETIQEWADEHDVIPVRRRGRDEDRLMIIRESERHDRHDELAWNDFYDELDREDYVVVYRGAEARRPFMVVERDEAVQRASIENETIEESLLEGETVTSRITETTVVERTIVEEMTIESEVVDREAVEEEIVDAELLTRQCASCEVDALDTDVDAGMIALDQFETGAALTDRYDVEIEVDEGWSLTKEILERLTIESRVVDTETTETDTLEEEHVEATVDVEGVQRRILESDLVDTESTPDDIIGTTTIHSEQREGDVIETIIAERKTVEEELSVRKLLGGELGEGETVSAESIHREVIESELVEDDDLDVEVMAVGTDETVETAEVETEETYEEEVVAEDEVVAEEETAVGADEAYDEELEAEAAAGEFRTTPEDEDEGKTVVDADGERVGMVVEVEGTTMYVDPHPSLTDRIKAALDWGGIDEDAYPVTTDQIARITDDRVELALAEPDEYDEGAV